MAQQGDGRGNDMRQPARPAPRPAARQPQQPNQPFNQQDDQFSRGFADDGVGQGGPDQRQGGARQQQPSFSAYRPEAYANQEKPAARQAPAAPEPFRPAAAPRQQQHHDPYHNAASDPYDAGHNDASWQSFNDYPETQRTPQFSGQSFYQEHDEPASNHDAQSVHDQFFSAEAEQQQRAAPPKRAAAPQAPARYVPDNDFEADDGYAAEPPPPPALPARAAPKPAPARPSREPERDRGGFEEDDADFGNWDNNNFGQQPPAPDAARPFAHNKFGADDDLDADYLHDEDEFEGEEDYAEPKKGGKKLMAAVLVGAVVTGGGLAYLYKSSMGGAETGEPALVTADARPIKEKPADPGGREFPNGSKLIYDRLDGAPTDGPRVAAREEGNSGEVPGVVTTGSNGTLEERIQTALQNAKKSEDGPEQTAANADLPRPVRTEIFRPDGSVDAARPQRRQAAAVDSEPAPRAASREAAPAVAAAPARAQIAAATPAAISSSGGGDGMFVQIAARNDEAAAMAAFADLKQKYASVLGAHSPSVRKVDLGEKGVWFRLLVGPMPSKADADKLCEDLKTAGMKGCFSRKD
jgi:sporulation related protein